MAEVMTEKELLAKYEGKIEAPKYVMLQKVKTSGGTIIGIGDLINDEGAIYKVDSITFDPWNKTQFWVYRSDETGKPLDNELLLFTPNEEPPSAHNT